MKIADSVHAVLDRIEAQQLEEELLELAPGETSLDFLQRVYRSIKQPMSRRMRAAIEALPFETPKLGAVAIASLTANDFAAALDRALERSGKTHEVKQLELKAEPE